MSRSIRIAVVALLLPIGAGAAEEAASVVTADSGRMELGVFPLSAQLNGSSTTQYGAGVLASWELRPGFALQSRFTHQFYVGLTPSAHELLIAGRVEEQERVDPWHQWSLLAGTELSPFRGEGVFAGNHVSVSMGVGGLLGLVSTRHAWLNSNVEFLPTNGFDIGLHPAAGFSLGLRLGVGRYLSLRAELTSVLSSGRASTVAGCSENDLEALRTEVAAGGEPGDAQVSRSCDVNAFEGGTLVPLALNTVKDGGANPVLQTFSAQVGAAVVF